MPKHFRIMSELSTTHVKVGERVERDGIEYMEVAIGKTNQRMVSHVALMDFRKWGINPQPGQVFRFTVGPVIAHIEGMDS